MIDQVRRAIQKLKTMSPILGGFDFGFYVRDDQTPEEALAEFLALAEGSGRYGWNDTETHSFDVTLPLNVNGVIGDCLRDYLERKASEDAGFLGPA